jgi:CHAT domain-containing protein
MGGLMGLLPLHAAGSGWGASRDNTASHVVSSYIPTFKAAYSRQKKLKPLSAPGREVLIVSMQTEGYNNLKVEKEVKAVKANFMSAEATTSALDTPSRSQVLEKLQSASIAHFICYGTSEALHPSNSGLVLRDGRLMVRDLAAVSLDQAQIAYLSTCSTAENKTTELVDESIHIASAFNLVGFPHVIGTLWPASNKIAEVMAPKFYEALNVNLQQGDGDGDAAAYALHDAMKEFVGRG